jgi:hypothetical protein
MARRVRIFELPLKEHASGLSVSVVKTSPAPEIN